MFFRLDPRMQWTGQTIFINSCCHVFKAPIFLRAQRESWAIVPSSILFSDFSWTFLCPTARAIWRGDGVFGPKLHLEGNMTLWDLLQRHEPKIFCQSLWFVDVPVIHPSCRRMAMLAMHLPIFECFSWLLFHQVILCQCFASVSYGKWAVNFWCRSSLVSGCQLCSLPHHPWIVSTEVPWPT